MFFAIGRSNVCIFCFGNMDDIVFTLELDTDSPTEIHMMAQQETSERSVKIMLFEAAIDKFDKDSPELAYCLAEFGSFMNLESFITRALDMLVKSFPNQLALLAYARCCLLQELDRKRTLENSEFYRIGGESSLKIPDIDIFISQREQQLFLDLAFALKVCKYD